MVLFTLLDRFNANMCPYNAAKIGRFPLQTGRRFTQYWQLSISLALLIYQKALYYTLHVLLSVFIDDVDYAILFYTWMNFRVSNATISVANVENAHHSTRLLAQTTLR